MSSKLTHKPIQFDYSKGYKQKLADAINAYWKCDVAYPGNSTYVQSTLINGVPVTAYNSDYKHPDVVWVYRDPSGKWIVRK